MINLAQNYLTRGFWGDEAWTSLISQLPYLQMLKTTAADFHPPAYYTVVELWYKIFPATEVSTRMISVFFYLLTVFMVYKIVITILRSSATSRLAGLKLVNFISGSRFWGILTALVVLVNPIFFQYAFEARNYTLFAFAATGSMYFLIRLCSAHSLSELGSSLAHSGSVNPRDIVGFVLFSTLGIYTHYYMFFTLAAQGIYILFFERKIFFKMIGIFALIGILYLPWIPFLFAQVTSVGQSYWIGGIDGRTHYEAFLRILGGEHQNMLRPILFWLSISLILVGLIQHIRQKSFERPYALIWLWATIPFVLATLPGFKIDGITLPFRPIFFWRYLINASIPLGLVMVHASQKLPKQIAGLSMGLVIVVSLVIDFWSFWRYPYTFKQAYSEKVLSQINASDQLVTILPSFAEVLYYRNRNGLENELIVLPEGLIQHSGKSLLDAYVANGIVKIGDYPLGGYFEMRPGQSVVKVESQSVE